MRAPGPRRRILRLLADSITTAHAVSPASWEVTLNPNWVRLNVGRQLVLYIKSGRLSLYAKPEFSSRSRGQLKRISVEIVRHKYRYFPDTQRLWFKVADADRVLPLVASAHKHFVRAAAQRHPVVWRSWQPAQSKGVVRLLRKVLNREVPDPRYDDSAAPTGWAELLEREAKRLPAFDPSNLKDGRERIRRQIVSRQGQASLRRRTMKLYRDRCAISGCSVPDVLEAAHIIPYWGTATNHPSNVILLRTDLHTLFDLGLIAINTKGYRVCVDERLKRSEYWKFAGRPMTIPNVSNCRPSKAALDQHREQSSTT